MLLAPGKKQAPHAGTQHATHAARGRSAAGWERRQRLHQAPSPLGQAVCDEHLDRHLQQGDNMQAISRPCGGMGECGAAAGGTWRPGRGSKPLSAGQEDKTAGRGAEKEPQPKRKAAQVERGTLQPNR